MWKNIYIEVARLMDYARSLALLLARLTIAYGFYNPAMMKFSDIGAVWRGRCAL